ncbi:DUF4394 domain-containing protein [Gloeobacter morelensis]|uniref:DUF4394 domain-containing protein n=1 Tax=Gloeobacter morelensis MG652769 TaxID=2781736 RepID=A0ABY3PRB3_9CYAN|nr:DUF4394 domain-containing protein [Gloeobacter morelensis]UFP96195.1 DUF4394 domain-containing protein [Gloeobacter morelensis MG652769]
MLKFWLVVVCLFFVAVAATAAPIELIGLAENNTLVRFEAGRPAAATTLKVSGVSGTLVGIDYRPADGKLYGLSEAQNLYTIDPAGGSASLVSTLSVPFTGGVRSGFDFNPSADRLRLVGADGQDLRVNVDLGATAVDGKLAYDPRDRNAKKTPQVSASAYTNSVAKAGATKLLNIDFSLDVLTLQEPPNDGVLKTIGPLGVDFGPASGFDILTGPGGKDRAFATSGSVFYTVDLVSGRARKVGTIGDGKLAVFGLAAVPGRP